MQSNCFHHKNAILRLINVGRLSCPVKFQ